MSGFRDFIPYGNCTEGIEATKEVETAQIFADIDQGDTSEKKIALACAACDRCPQLSYCRAQQDEMATELWRRGAGIAVVAAQGITITPNFTAPPTSERPSFKFDIQYMPQDPVRYLGLIRQAVRAGQINMDGATPLMTYGASPRIREKTCR